MLTPEKADRKIFSVVPMSFDDIPEAAILEREVFPDPWSEAMLRGGFTTASQHYFAPENKTACWQVMRR